MKSIIILFSSSTSAVRLKEGLTKEGFVAKVIQTPTKLITGGCNYSVKTTENALEAVRKILTLTGLRTRGIYLDTQQEGEIRYKKLFGGAQV
ncbi:MAG: DUF3343 domain-containing protein [Bacillota bacterium]|nr:DUF3343 domain-containing protein [Bacillota bacterium]